MRLALKRLFAVYSPVKTSHYLSLQAANFKANHPSDQELLCTFQERSFSLQHSPESQEIKLLKSLDDTDIEITFKGRDPYKQQREITKYEENAGPAVAFNEFQVLVSRKSSDLQVLFDCSIFNSEFFVNGILVAPDFSKFERDALHMQAEIYKGPPFVELGHPLQKQFLGYLESLGIDNKLAGCINSYSSLCEIRMRLVWLEGLKEFLID